MTKKVARDFTYRKLAEVTLHGLLNDQANHGCGYPDVRVEVVTDPETIKDYLYAWAWDNFNVDLNAHLDNPIVATVQVTNCGVQSDYQGEDFTALLIDDGGWVSTLRFVTCAPAALYINNKQLA